MLPALKKAFSGNEWFELYTTTVAGSGGSSWTVHLVRIVKVTLMVSLLSFIVTAGRAQSQPEAKPVETARISEGMHDFDFEAGEWRVHHRVKAATGGWTEFDGVCRNRMLINGSANVEEHTFVRPAGTSYGIAIRAYDAGTKGWEIWWIDGCVPHGALDPPVKGCFDKDHVGTFYSDRTLDGKPMRTRSNLVAHHC